jgi:hypothetical protein
MLWQRATQVAPPDTAAAAKVEWALRDDEQRAVGHAIRLCVRSLQPFLTEAPKLTYVWLGGIASVRLELVKAQALAQGRTQALPAWTARRTMFHRMNGRT